MEKGRLAETTFERILGVLRAPGGIFREIHIHHRIIEAMREIPREQVADLPDRIIAATALAHRVSVISRDRKIPTSQVATIW